MLNHGKTAKHEMSSDQRENAIIPKQQLNFLKSRFVAEYQQVAKEKARQLRQAIEVLCSFD